MYGAARSGPTLYSGQHVTYGHPKILTEGPFEAGLLYSLRDVDKWSEAMRVPFMALYGETYFREQWQNWVDGIQNYYDKRAGDICVADIEKIKARTLIIHGLKDRMVALEHPDFLHHHIKGSRLYIMPEGKHNVHMKYHREFNFLAEHFLHEEMEKGAGKHMKTAQASSMV